MRLSVVHIEQSEGDPLELKLLNKKFCTELPESLEELS